MDDNFYFAKSSDASDILEIYGPMVLTTPVCFELEVPSMQEMQRRIRTIQEQYPWLVYKRDEKVLGYAYASPHRARPAYQWSVDLSIYIHPSMRRKGLGYALYTALFALLRLQGYINAYAGITLPNSGSVGLHEAMGFTPVGVYKQVGYKLDKWHDVGHWQFSLQEHADMPTAPLPITLVKETSACLTALQTGLNLFRKEST